MAKLTGVAIGTSGSWNGVGNVASKATDGDLTTFFDAPTQSGAWTGLDLGSAKTVSAIAYAPRPTFEARMVGGVFQASSDPNFVNDVVLAYAVPGQSAGLPPARALTTVVLPAPITRQYWRYLGAKNFYCNIAEMQLFEPGIVCGEASNAVAPAYAAGPAPCVVWMDISKSADTRADRRLWHTQTVGVGAPDDTRVGPVVAVVYTAPGSYKVTCDVTHASGAVDYHTVTVNVDPVSAYPHNHYYISPATGNDTNTGMMDSAGVAHPWASLARAAAVAAAGNCRITIMDGPVDCSAPLTNGQPANLPLGPNVTIAGRDPGSGNPRPVMMCGGWPVFYAPAGSDDLLIYGLRFDSAGTASGGLLVAPTSAHGRAQPLQSAASNVVMYDCDFGCLTQGPLQVNGDFALLGCNQGPWNAMSGQGVLVDGNGRFDVSFNAFAGCYGQACIRTDGPTCPSSGHPVGLNVGQQGSIESNQVTQDVTIILAGIDLRSANGIVVSKNTMTDCQLSMSSSDNTSNSIGPPTVFTTVTQGVLATGNQYSQTQPPYVPPAGKPRLTNWVTVKSRSAHIEVVNENPGPIAGGGNWYNKDAGLIDVFP